MNALYVSICSILWGADAFCAHICADSSRFGCYRLQIYDIYFNRTIFGNVQKITSAEKLRKLFFLHFTKYVCLKKCSNFAFEE